MKRVAEVLRPRQEVVFFWCGSEQITHSAYSAPLRNKFSKTVFTLFTFISACGGTHLVRPSTLAWKKTQIKRGSAANLSGIWTRIDELKH